VRHHTSRDGDNSTGSPGVTTPCWPRRELKTALAASRSGATSRHLLIWAKLGVHQALLTRLPRRPPPLEELLAKEGGLQKAMPVLAQLASASQGDRYLHWDDLRHRTPPQGLSHEQWWLAEKLARRGSCVALPLLSRDGHPLCVISEDEIWTISKGSRGRDAFIASWPINPDVPNSGKFVRRQPSQ
jgi:hypothetical protein